jgi:hypothetical protein
LRQEEKVRNRFALFPLPFSGAFAKLRKATLNFVMSVRPAVRLSAWNNSAPTGRILMKFRI